MGARMKALKLSPRSTCLLRYLASLHPYGLSSTSPIPCQSHDMPGMDNMRGLIRRGWAYEAECKGIFCITPAGLDAASRLPAPKKRIREF